MDFLRNGSGVQRTQNTRPLASEPTRGPMHRWRTVGSDIGPCPGTRSPAGLGWLLQPLLPSGRVLHGATDALVDEAGTGSNHMLPTAASAKVLGFRQTY